MVLNTNPRSYITRIIFIITSISLMVYSAPVVQAESIGLEPTGWPDITTSNILTTYEYNATTGIGHFIARAGSYDSVLNDTMFIDNGSDYTFHLDVYVNGSGEMQSGGITVSGDMWNPTFEAILVPGPTLLVGSLTEFGFSTQETGGKIESQLEFIFDVTSGNLQTSQYFPSTVGVLMHKSGFGGDWTQNFAVSNGAAQCDLFNVPEPTCIVMLLTAVLGLWSASLRKSTLKKI
jgi:hypothetical protein